MKLSSTLSLVGCGDTKSDEREAAFKMYDASYFERKWLVGSYLGIPAVASAEHGLLWGHDRIEPYEASVHEMSLEERKEWGEDLVAEIPDRYDEVIFLTSGVYASPIKSALPDGMSVREPFRGKGGIQGQEKWMTSMIERVEGETA